MSDKQLQQPKRWLIPYPEKKALTGHPCQDACNGNQKMGQLLHYFLCEASWELERQELDESCKVVKFTRSHEHILKRVHISEKSLIQFLKQFNAWNFVVSEQYGKEFTVQAEPIQKAMYTPVFTKKMRRKSCSTTSENTTTSDAPSEVIESCKVYFLHEKVEALEEVQLYNIALEARIQALSEALEQESCKVVELQEKVEAGKLYNFTLSTWIDAVSDALKIPSPIIDSVIDRDIRDSEKEESEGEQSDTTTSAPLLSLDAALSPQSENDTQQRIFTLLCLHAEPRANPSVERVVVMAETDEAWQGYPLGQPDHKISVQYLKSGWKLLHEEGEHDAPPPPPSQDLPSATRPILQAEAAPEIDEEWCNAETEHRLPAIPKPAIPSEPASHEQNRDASPRNVAVESDLGAVASAPIPPVPSEVSPPRTMRATVVSPPPQVLVVSQQFTSVENWKQAQEAFVEQLRGIWKTTSPDFKRQAGNWNAYRKQYLDRWLKANPEPLEVQFTPDGKTLFDEWCSLFKVTVEPIKANIQAANWLAEPCTTWAALLGISRTEVLRNEKDWCYANDKNGYYKRGVKLFDLKRDFEGWQSYQQSLLDKAEREKSRPQNKYGTVSGLPRLEIDPEWLEAMGGR